MTSALPKWLRTAWIILAPLGLVFAARIAWEKTVWTLHRGPQNVGFSLMHTSPAFFCCRAFLLLRAGFVDDCHSGLCDG
jgi:hypothetical protein